MDDLGQYEKPLNLYRETLIVHESLYGIKHGSAAATMFGMAGVLYRLDHDEDSLEMFKKSLSVYETVYGPEYPWAVDARLCIAQISEQLECHCSYTFFYY